ncbi:MAG: hypothetical protein PWR29_1103 [Methanolobus sp.]|jgi:hypothetical protein|nr:hypothetical protein [Methanolobus sp.]
MVRGTVTASLPPTNEYIKIIGNLKETVIKG